MLLVQVVLTVLEDVGHVDVELELVLVAWLDDDVDEELDEERDEVNVDFEVEDLVFE